MHFFEGLHHGLWFASTTHSLNDEFPCILCSRIGVPLRTVHIHWYQLYMGYKVHNFRNTLVKNLLPIPSQKDAHIFSLELSRLVLPLAETIMDLCNFMSKIHISDTSLHLIFSNAQVPGFQFLASKMQAKPVGLQYGLYRLYLCIYIHT